MSLPDKPELTLGLSAATLGFAAQPEPQGGYSYRISPPSSNPHDVFRTVIKRAGPERAWMANCDCPMMKADAAMRDRCMNMLGDPRRTAPSPKAG